MEKVRYPLGLPRGSVRAILALAVFGTVILLLWLGREIDQGVWLVNYVVLGYYFASRQNGGTQAAAAEYSPTEPPPLRLPRGTIRWLLLSSFFVTAGWLTISWLQAGKNVWEQKAFLPMLSLTGFFVGRAVGVIGARFRKTDTPRFMFVQDLKAFVGIVCAASFFLHFTDVDFVGRAAFLRFSQVYILFYFGNR